MLDKSCSKCKTRKPKTEFYGKTKKSGYCKSCQTEAQKFRRLFIRNYLLSNQCVQCGENHPACLEFHHRDQNTKVFEVAKMIRYNTTIEKMLVEINKCDVLCCNCHKKITAKQLNWTYRLP